MDAVLGQAQLDQYGEAIEQAKNADMLVVTKGDLAPAADVASLVARLRKLNTAALLYHADRGELPDAVWRDSAAGISLQKPSLAVSPPAASGFPGQRQRKDLRAAHGPNVGAVTLRLQTPVDAAQLVSGMEQIAALLGKRLLRAKGIVQLARTRVSVQMVGQTGVSLEELPLLDIPEQSWIVLIGSDLEVAALVTVFRCCGLELATSI